MAKACITLDVAHVLYPVCGLFQLPSLSTLGAQLVRLAWALGRAPQRNSVVRTMVVYLWPLVGLFNAEHWYPAKQFTLAFAKPRLVLNYTPVRSTTQIGDHPNAIGGAIGSDQINITGCSIVKLLRQISRGARRMNYEFIVVCPLDGNLAATAPVLALVGDVPSLVNFR